MNFNQYVADMVSKSLNKPKRVKVLGKSTSELPHEPATLSKGLTQGTAETNNDRATSDPATGEVVGLDPATGEALVRQPGNRVVRVQAEGATAGNTVSVSSSQPATRSSLSVVKKSGTVTSKANVTGSGWQPVEGRPGVSRLTATSSRKVQGLDQLKDPCVPPDVKLQLVLAEQARGVGITDRGVVGFTSSVTGQVLNNQASRDTQAYIDQLYEEIKAQGKQSQTLPQQLSLDSQGGTSTLGQQFSSTLASLWKCVDGNCVQAPDGIFATKEQCQVNCGPKTFNCVNGTCVEVSGGTGKFKTLAECINGGCNTRYTCIDGSPVPSKTGEFATLEAAIAGGCFWGYDCDGMGNCSPAIGGAFKSLACCQQGCVDVSQGAVLTAISPPSGARSDEGAFIRVNGQSSARYYSGVDENGATSDAKAVNVSSPVQIQGDLRSFEPGGSPVSPPGRFALSRVIVLSPEVKRHSITLSGIQLRFPINFPGVSGVEPSTDAELDAMIGNLRWAQYAIQPAKVLGPLQAPFNYQAFGGVPATNPGSYKAQLNYNLSPLTLAGNFNLYQERTWESSQIFDMYSAGAYIPGAFGSTGRSQYNPTTWFTKYTSWAIDRSQTPEEIVVNYPDVTWDDPMADFGPGPANFWSVANNVTYANSPVIAPGVFPSPLYKHGSGRSLFYPENWGVDFRATIFSMGSAVIYPPIPESVTVPPDFVPNTSTGASYWAPHRYFFTIAIEYGDNLPSFYGEPALEPITRNAADRKALLQGPDWTDYNANFAETEDYNP
jgi:hypothetical protein